MLNTEILDGGQTVTDVWSSKSFACIAVNVRKF